MGSQFIHADSYGRQAGKGKHSGNTIDSIAGEAEREEGQCYHVADPKKPIILFGESFREAGEEAKKWAESMKDARGHAYRKDGLCMVAGVVSVPEDCKDWDSYKRDAVEWLQKKYGECLKSVIEHTDESHRHFHFAVVPKLGERFETIHQGYAAQRGADPKRGDRKRTAEVKADGRRQGIHAYQTAMRDYQKEFYESVSMKHGLTKIGPGRRRLSRAEWKQEQAQAKEIAQNITKIRERHQLLNERIDEVLEGREDLKIKELKLAKAEELWKAKLSTGDFQVGKHLGNVFHSLSKSQIAECWAVTESYAEKLRQGQNRVVSQNEITQTRGHSL